MKNDGKIISILGDSISTYEGYTAHQGLFYDRFIQHISQISSVEDTWWMQVIKSLGGKLGVNDSFSGSTVSGNVSISGTSVKRLTALGAHGEPDVILVFMGANDWGSYVMPVEFKKAYLQMITGMQMLYPKAEIYCATIIRGEDPEDRSELFMNVEGCLSPMLYSNAIKEVAAQCGVHVADLARHNLLYHTIDGIHPDVRGMKEIAQMWISELTL